MRKRMSVGGHGETGGIGGGSSSKTADDFGLGRLLRKEGCWSGAGRTLFVSSCLDRAGAKKKAFENKDTRCFCSDDAKDLEERGLDYVAFNCRKGFKPESPNQDAFSMLVVENQFALYGVYDGHGPNGHDASEEALNEIVKRFVDSLSENLSKGVAETEDSLAELLEKAFTETQKVLECSDEKYSTSGTTCTVAYHNLTTNSITVAHVGDSRAVLACRRTSSSPWEKHETVDHKPNDEKEKKRIESATPPGRVIFDGYYNHRVFSQKGMYPGLNMSRAMGDVLGHREAGLTAVPDVKTYSLAQFDSADQLVLLLCSDGVWEFMQAENVLDFCVKGGSLESAVHKITKESYDKWMEDSDNEISDDITAIYIKLR
eukprot:TRINITY_DN12393_c0_g1_i1.p1 TRINITY_DN12393_c0_g1~~TRINITY_DN12393_c0_g1_i1.p1  ORF type:complete len:373 (-),score=73.01 TRINITY_DN12393_c0_g1_i1:125-1243(-)